MLIKLKEASQNEYLTAVTGVKILIILNMKWKLKITGHSITISKLLATVLEPIS